MKYRIQGIRKPKQWIVWFAIIFTSSVWVIFQTKKIKSRKASMHDLMRHEPYLTRVLDMKERCSQTHLDSTTILSKHFKYDDNLKLVMCENPKVASTTWQILFLKLGGFRKEITPKLITEWGYHGTPNKHFKQLNSEADALRRLTKYTTFFATRHPFERLVSAYVDKFSSKSRWDAYKQREGRKIAENQFGTNIHGINTHWLSKTPLPLILHSPAFLRLSASRKKQVLKQVFVLKSGEISFPQFVNYIITNYQTKEQLQTMDHHWMPQVYNCMPCYVNYSFVIRFETLAIDSQHLLNYVQREKTAKIPFPQTGPSQTSQELTHQMFQLIPEKQVDELRKIYLDDFYVLGYDPYVYRGYESAPKHKNI